MRIAMYSDSYYPYVSGVTTALLNLSDTLARAGHEIFIQAPRPKQEVDTSFLHKNITLHYVNAMDVMIYPDYRIGTGLPLSLQTIRDFNPDVIHLHTFPMSLSLEGLLIAKALRKPVVQTFHTYYMHEDFVRVLRITNPRLTHLLSAGGWRLHQALSRLCTATISPTYSVARDLKKHHISGKITVIPNMLSESCYALPKNPRRTLKRILYVGRLSPEKRVDMVLESFALALKKIPSLELHVIGDGPEETALKNLADSLYINGQTHWHGKIPYTDLLEKRLYHEGDLFISLSQTETFGYTSLEAMAHGLPVIILDSPTNREIVGEGGGILLRNFKKRESLIERAAHAMVEAQSQPLQTLRKRAYSQSEKFQPQILLPEYESLYASLAQNTKGES